MTLLGTHVNNLSFGRNGDGDSQNETQAIFNGANLRMPYSGNARDIPDYCLLNAHFYKDF